MRQQTIKYDLFLPSSRDADSLTAPRLEPEADLNQNGTWTRIDTEANEVSTFTYRIYLKHL